MELKQICIIILLLPAVLIMFGCDQNHNRTTQASKLEYDDCDTIVFRIDNSLMEVDNRYVKKYYQFKESKIQEFSILLDEKTTPPTDDFRMLQLLGAQLVVFIVDKDRNPKHELHLEFQDVEGIGGKNNFKSELLDSQNVNCETFIQMAKKIGQEISEEQAEVYISKFMDSEINYKHWRYWKN